MSSALRSLCIVPLVLIGGMTFVSHAPVESEVKQPPLYFPVRVGTKWVYQRNHKEVTRLITQSQKQEDNHIVTVSEIGEDGVPRVKQIVEVSEHGLRLMQSREVHIDPPMRLLNTPIRVGDTWDCEFSYTGKGGGIGGLATVIKRESIQVPAGEFMCVRVDRSYTAGGDGDEHSTWYCAGIGVVWDSSNAISTVLKSFTPGE